MEPSSPCLGKDLCLYAYWGDTWPRPCGEESDTVVNLASQEYSRCIAAHQNRVPG